MEIKIDKNTLPKDGQYVWFKMPDMTEYKGFFLEDPGLFNVGNDGGDNEGKFFTAWEVMEWESA